MKKLKTFNAIGSLAITSDHITGKMMSVQEDGQTVETKTEADILGGGVAGIAKGTERKLTIIALFTDNDMPRFSLFTEGEPEVDVTEAHIKQTVKSMLRQMEDKLE